MAERREGANLSRVRSATKPRRWRRGASLCDGTLASRRSTVATGQRKYSRMLRLFADGRRCSLVTEKSLHRGDFGPGAALPSPALPPENAFSELLAAQVIVPGGRGPEPPGARGYEPPPQDATPRSASRTVSRNARHPSEDGIIYHPRTRMSILTIGLAKK